MTELRDSGGGLSEEGRMLKSLRERAQCRRVERQKTTREDLGAGLEAHGEMSRHCNISV